MFSRIPIATHNRGRIALPAAGGGGYIAPAVPVQAKTGGFWTIRDLAGTADGASVTTWPARYGSYGAFTGVNATYSTTAWTTPAGGTPCIRLNGTSAYLRNDALAVLQNGDDLPVEFVIAYRRSGAGGASKTCVSWSSTTSTTPKKLLRATTGPFRWLSQGTDAPPLFATDYINQLAQVVRVRVTNTAPGTNINLWRNEVLDANTCAIDSASQAIDIFTIGAQWNGAGGPTNFEPMDLIGFWVRDPGAAALTDAEGLEILNWFMGAYDVAPLYSGVEPFLLPFILGQSNGQGYATGSPPGLPDPDVKMWMRSLNNGVLNPTALAALNTRDDAGTPRVGAWSYATTGTFPGQEHHIGMCGQGATYISDWHTVASNQQGLYSTDLLSEQRRSARMTRARLGGSPTVHAIWWQGENDANNAATWPTATYQAALVSEFARIRENFGAGTPIHLVMLNSNMSALNATGISEVRAAQNNMPGVDSDVYLVETDDMVAATYLQPDNVHYNAAGQQEIWNRIKTSILAV